MRPRKQWHAAEGTSPHENLVVCGPSGTGKSHLLEGLGYAAIEAGHHVSWFSLEDLGALLHRHRADGTVARAVRRLMHAELIIIDDIGLLPVPSDTAEALYRVVGAAYEQRSLALHSLGAVRRRTSALKRWPEA